MVDIFVFIMVMVTQVYTCVQTHQNVHINYVQAFLCTNCTSKKLEGNGKKKSTKKKKWKEVFVDKEEDIC